MIKTGCILIVLVLILTLFTGCSGRKLSTDKITVVTTLFPVYDWVLNIAGESAEVILLTDNGTDLHSYQPTAADIIKISQSDMFIYIGGPSDKWTEEIETESVNKLCLADVLGKDMLLETAVTDSKTHHHDHDDEHTFDEHIWLSLKNAKIICTAIADKLSLLGVDCKTSAETYIEKLNELDSKFEQTVTSSKTDTVIVADRFPFIYLITDYSLKYYAAFSGCESDANATFETVAFLASKLKELETSKLIVTDNLNTKLATTVADTAGVKDYEILSLNSMQSVSHTDMEKGISYLSLMEKNLNVLEKVLN